MNYGSRGFSKQENFLVKLSCKKIVNSHTFKVNCPPNTNLSSKIGDNESLLNFKSEHRSKSKTDFNRSCYSSSK